MTNLGPASFAIKTVAINTLFWSLAPLSTDDFMNKSNIEYFWVGANYGTMTYHGG